MARQAFILGGTGQIGRAVARDLLDQGWKVAVAHRGRRPLPPELIEGGASVSILDREQSGELAHALAEGADAVIDIASMASSSAALSAALFCISSVAPSARVGSWSASGCASVISWQVGVAHALG